MRIRDWSSDVCSSDLSVRCWRLPRIWPADPAFFLEAASNDTRIACFTRDQIERLAVRFASIAKLRAAMMRTGGRVSHDGFQGWCRNPSESYRSSAVHRYGRVLT